MRARWRSVGFGVLAVVIWCLAATVAAAQTELIKIQAKGPVYVRADEVEFDEKSQLYKVRGEVEITRGAVRLMADTVVLHAQTLVAEADGNARLTIPGQIITGKRILTDLQAGTGKIYEGQIFVESSHYYLSGREIEKTGRDTYKVRNGAFTTCDGKDPAWNLAGKEMEITLEGYGKAKNTTFRVRDFPVIWTPWIMFPAKFKRQSGLLAPHFANTKRDGFVFSQPYFQTLSESQDLTFTVNYMSKRGTGVGLEYRYFTEPGSKGMFMVDYLHKDRKAQELHDEGDLAKPYDSRYWIRAMVDQKLFNDSMRFYANIDWVSDPDYLKEFDFGNTGYYSSYNRFLNWFGRELDPKTDPLRENKINLQKAWGSASFNADVKWWDDLSSDGKSTQQQLPKLSLDATSQPVGDTGLYFKMASSYAYLHREEGAQGHLADISPTLSLPFNFDDYLYLEPSITYKQRAFSVDTYDYEDPDNEKTGFTQVWEAAVQSSTYLFRVFHFGTAANPFSVKHGVRPYIDWFYRPEMGDDGVASMARLTQGRSNVFTYGLKNSFTYKIMAPDDKTGEIRAHYREFMRLNFSQEFDYNKYRVDNETGRYWGLVVGRLEFEPTDNIYAEAESKWNLYKNRFEQLNAQIIAKDWRGDSIDIDYLQTHDSVHQVNTKFTLALNEEWALAYYNRKDLKGEIDFEQRYEIRYAGQCWGIRAFYIDTHYRESGYWLVFSLGGFGELFGYGRIEQDATYSDD